MSESSAQQRGSAVEPEPDWWRSRRVLYPFGSVTVLILVGALSSGLFPTSTWASLATGMTWSLAWLILLVLLVGYGGQWVRTRLG